LKKICVLYWRIYLYIYGQKSQSELWDSFH